MRLESALNTGREGITAHGQAIAVIGDNIANSNTIGFKNQRAVFGDILGESVGDRVSEVVSGAGDGVSVRDIQSNFTVGPIQATGRELDVALSGGGFFQVGDATSPQFTRAGSFELNGDGLLVTSFGLPVLGYTGADTATLGTIDMTKVELQIVPTTEAQLYGNLSSAATSSNPPVAPLSFQEVNSTAALTNVVSVYDSLGDRHDVVFAYYRTGVNSWSIQAYGNGKDLGQAEDQPVLVGQTNFTFDSGGRLSTEAAAQANMALTANWSTGAAPSAIAVDFGSFSQFAGATLLTNFSQNGQGTGDIKGYEINAQGAIHARLTNGLRAQVGSLSIAMVRNEDGLVRSGTSVFGATDQSGEITTGLAGSGTRGKILSASLEYSNVDLAGQFVDLVVMQRAYAANSKVISTASDVIKDTIALIR